MNKLPKRKQLRLKEYDYSQNGYYFITICTYNRQNLFEKSVVGNDLCVVPTSKPQNLIIDKWLKELQHKFGIIIEQYIIMPNHIHFILVIDNENKNTLENAAPNKKRSLSDMIQWFKTMTTNDFINLVKNNLIQPFDKKIWQKSYYEHIIRNKEEHIEIIQYILNNPLKSDIREDIERTDT